MDWLNDVLQRMLLLLDTPGDVLQVMHEDNIIATVALIVLGAVGLCYALLYHVIDRPSLNKRKHLWVAIAIAVVLVFASTLWYVPHAVQQAFLRATQISVAVQRVELRTSDEVGTLEEESDELPLEIGDAPVFDNQETGRAPTDYGIVNALPTALAASLWTFLLFCLLTLLPIPRRYSVNCRTLKII